MFSSQGFFNRKEVDPQDLMAAAGFFGTLEGGEVPPGGFERLTEDGGTRLTEDGGTRITEDAP